jgi:hypothetical protein
LAGLLSLSSAADSSQQRRTQLLAATPQESVLLLDDHAVAKTMNLTQQFFAAKRHPANPVMRRTEKWEGVGPYIWGNRLMQDERTAQFRLWYIAYDFAGNFYRWGYATSPDGLAWNKPNLGLERVRGELATNCLPLGPHPDKGTRSIARDPRPQTPAGRRYLGVRFTYDGELVSFSPDGLVWTEHPANPVWHVPSDIIHVMWDDRRNQFVAYYKVWELAGTEITASGEQRRFLAHMPTFTPTKLSDDKAAFEGPVIHFHKGVAAEVKQEKFVLRAVGQGKDDGGGTSLSGAWTAKRVQAWARSNDGIHWEDEQVVLRADDRDSPTSNIQYMFVMKHGGYYLGFITMHDEAGNFRIQLAHSADGLRWSRPWREPWLDVGPAGAFDRGMVLGPADPILGEREMWFPYGGFPIRHDSADRNWESAIGLATMRLDGFAAWRASLKQGELTTQPFRCDGDRVFVNADASRAGGSVAVEVLDEAGVPLAGYEAAACRAIRTDTLGPAAASDGWLQWKTKVDLKAVRGKRICLRFVLQNADLFSFRVADEKTVKLPAPRATNR